MPNLVDCLGFISCKLTVLIHGFFLQEVTDLVARVEEVVIANVVLVRRGKFRLTNDEQLDLRQGIKLMIEHSRVGGPLS